jgi:15-cis-phytoene synthase
MSSADQITKKSRSNLAFAFLALPTEKKRDITTFYAFCRRVDDAADDPGIALEKRRQWLQNCRRWLREKISGEPTFADGVRALITKYRISLDLFEDILTGVESDLEPVRYPSFTELSEYCYRVASAVGLVSIEIFGYRNARCRDYAHQLGMALQLTNIIRDVETDLQNGGRIYLPLDEMKRFGYSPNALEQREYDERFVRLMEFQAARAKDFFAKAKAALPREDRGSMVAAEGMRGIYSALLRKIEKDGFKVFRRKYRLNDAEKLFFLVRQFVWPFAR